MKWPPASSPEDEELPSLTASLQSSDRSSNRSPSLSDDGGEPDAAPTQRRRSPSEVDRSTRSGRSAKPLDRSSRSGTDRPSKSGSSPPPPPRRRPRKPNHLRFSHTRRSSLNGTTVYPAAHMATLDTYLRSTSGMRLQTDGTCTFLFEEQRFFIESASGTEDDFLFYASLGSLKAIQRRNGWRPKYLLRQLAKWNEELKHRRASDGGGKQENAGLLRIDSSKTEGPQVAFIYYGHIAEIKDAEVFEEALDDFVDDALAMSEKLHAVEDAPSEEDAPGPNEEEGCNQSSRSVVNRSGHSFNKSNASFNKSNQSIGTAAAVTSTDIFHATANRKSVFAKMMDSLRSKSSSEEDIGALAFVDPNHSAACAFVVDKRATAKPTIVLRREGEPPPAKGRSFHDGERSRSFHEGNQSSFHSSHKSGSGRSFHGPRRGSTVTEGSDHAASSKSVDACDDKHRRSRRHSCHASDAPRRRRPNPTKRHSLHDERGREPLGKTGGGRHRDPHRNASRSRRMNNSTVW